MNPLPEKLCGLVLAAGLSSRMGDFKPLLSLCGKTLIENTVDSMFAGGVDSVVVVTGYRAEELERCLYARYASKVYTVRNHDYAVTDMLQSIKIGVRALSVTEPDCGAFYLLPGDMPVVSPETFMLLRRHRNPQEKSIVFPTLQGFRKHPPLIDASFMTPIINFSQDGGLRQLWKQYTQCIRTVPVDDAGCWIDVDTPNDYQKCKQLYEIKEEVFAYGKN